jgi:hypothetical protein
MSIHSKIACATVIAGVAALAAADRAVDRGSAGMPICALNASVVGEVIGLLAMFAEHAHETLREHGFERGRDEIRLHAHVHEARHGAGRVVGVQRGENEWPVSDACTAICAVSRSRISPTRMTSGSCRRIERSPRAKVRPAFSET